MVILFVSSRRRQIEEPEEYVNLLLRHFCLITALLHYLLLQHFDEVRVSDPNLLDRHDH